MRHTKEQTEETRNKLLAAALKIFTQKGFSATRLEDIAKEAGLTRGALYWHFKNKLELFTEVYISSFTVAFFDFQRFLSDDLPIKDNLRNFLINFSSNLLENPEYQAINILHYSIEWNREVQNTVFSAFKKQIDERERTIVDIFEHARANKEIPENLDVKTLGLTLKIFIRGLANNILGDHCKIKKEDLAKSINFFIDHIFE